jgi:hypothetical protein
MQIEKVKEISAHHRVFLGLIASAVTIRSAYTKDAMELFQEELNKAYEPTRKDIEEQWLKAIKEATIPEKKKALNAGREKAFSKAHHKMVTKPMQEKWKEEEKINRFLYNIMASTVPDSVTILITKCIDEILKAKDPRDLLTIISMYNKGIFDQVLTSAKEQQNGHETKNSSNSGIMLPDNASGNEV